MAVGPGCYSLKSQCMLITQTFPSLFFVLPPSVFIFFLFSLFLFPLSLPFSYSTLPSMPNCFFFSPAIDFVSLFLSLFLAVTSQRSEDAIPTLHSSLLISGLYLYFCTAVNGSPLPYSDIPQLPSLFTCSHSFLQTHLGDLNLIPGGGQMLQGAPGLL